MFNPVQMDALRISENQLPRISFDEEYCVHTLDREQILHTSELEQESNQFVSKLEEFHKIIQGVLEILEKQEQWIEKEKLKAIGQKNKVDAEVDTRNRQKSTLELHFKEKQNELERYNLQYESLARVVEEQQALIEKLSSNEI